MSFWDCKYIIAPALYPLQLCQNLLLFSVRVGMNFRILVLPNLGFEKYSHWLKLVF